MNFVRKNIGLGLILLGSIMLAAQHLARFTMVNALLVVPLIFIVAGLVIHVWGMKRDSNY